jgi:two-component system chemotaxis sensor kinase CheA
MTKKSSVELFSVEWQKLSIKAKKKSLTTMSSLENLLVIAVVSDHDLEKIINTEMTRLGLDCIVTKEVQEAIDWITRYGSRIVMIISNISLLSESGIYLRRSVIENTNDTPFVQVAKDKVPDEVRDDQYELRPHVSITIGDLKTEVWFNFLKIDLVSRVSFLAEEIKHRIPYIQNAQNILLQTEELILSLEECSDSSVVLDTIFGNIHTLKGGSGFLQPKTLHKFMHRFEDYINKLQSHGKVINSDQVTLMLRVLDKAKELLEDLTAHYHRLYMASELEKYFDVGNLNDETPVTEPAVHLVEINLGSNEDSELKNEKWENEKFEDLEEGEELESIENNDEVRAPKISQASVPAGASASPQVYSAASQQKVELKQSNANLKTQEDKSLKVPISLLDTLMHISGELTVVRNMINKIDRNLKIKNAEDKEYERMSGLLEELHRLNGSIQKHLLDLRKVPIKEVVAPLNRVVRDVSKQLGKIVTLKIEGANLRIDTFLAEVLNNSLIHLVRNSVDHGFETPKQRTAKGKSQNGTLLIHVWQEKEFVYVKIVDDGRGMQTELIRSRALDRGLITQAQAVEMPNEKIWKLIFSPGFSTAEKVTDISGRGIGMSAVKESVESLGGDIIIDSVIDQGTTMKLVLPLPKSVLIARCIFVMISGLQLGINSENIFRFIHLDKNEEDIKVLKVEDYFLLSLNEEIIPIADLRSVLGVRKKDEIILKTIVVLQNSSGLRLGIIVDELLEFENTVVKPFTDYLKAFDIFFGTTFLGDGSIGLIFNVDGLFNVLDRTSKASNRVNRDVA